MKEILYTLYKHTFPNNKVYIGITSKPAIIRWGENGKGYLKLNKNGKPTQSLMYNAIKKYGWHNIQHEIIYTTKNKHEIERLERYYITEIYKSNNPEFGYNIDSGGRYCGRMSIETKRKISYTMRKFHYKKPYINALKRIPKNIKQLYNG